jgi:mannose-6-phosphate isomerase-like protein (cupin superfamily)
MKTSYTAGAILAAFLGIQDVQAFEPIISIGGEHPVIHPDGTTDEIVATQEQTDGLLGIMTIGSDKEGFGPGPAIVHRSRAEFWYVLEGTYEFHIGDQIVEGGPGTFIGVDAGQSHGFLAKSPGRLLVTYMPGGYEHFFLEWDRQGLKRGPALGPLEESFGATRPAR